MVLVLFWLIAMPVFYGALILFGTVGGVVALVALTAAFFLMLYRAGSTTEAR